MLSSIFTLALRVGTRGYSYKFSVPSCSTDLRHRFFSVRVVATWNSLPPDLVESDSLQMFKNGLLAELGDLLYHYG